MNIAILGGGVAGVSSAIALTRCGFDVRIYERRASATTIGAGIVIWPNATFILDLLDVLDEIVTVAGKPARMRRLTHDNEELARLISTNLIA